MTRDEEIAYQITMSGRLKFGPDGYQRVVFTNGCFDVLHPGHIDVLRRCREISGPRGCVVVALNGDKSVRRLKGEGRPLLTVDHRAAVLSALRYVDFVVVFDEDTPIDIIRALKPDVIVKGGDYKADDVVGSALSDVVIVPTVSGWSTTSIIGRINGG